MTYKELLKLCTEEPGCIQTKEQREADSNMRYMEWLDRSNEEYMLKKQKKKIK